MRTFEKLILVLGVLSLLVFGFVADQAVAASSGDGVVKAVFFFSPTCGHCHDVMTNVLPVLREQYGDALVVAEVDTMTSAGGALYQAMVARYAPEVAGVPTLIVGDKHMVGSREIPEMFPGYVEGYLAQGGVDWPDLPGLSAAIGEAATDSGGNTEPAEPLSFWQRLKERYTRDLAANVLSTVVLLGLLATIAAVAVPRNWQPRITERFGSVAVYALLAVGLVAAGYLAYVETTGNEAVCGPVGDCNSVQQSQYALLFGFLPIAVLGAIGYVALLIAYVAARAGGESIRPYARAATFAMAAFGVLFSTYLTFLEPFVIGATCAWCLTSAVCMALIALLTAGPGWQALDTLEKKLAFAR